MRYKAALIALLISAPVAAHQAPSGAQYLPECCNQQDCAPVSDVHVEELGGGHVRMFFSPGAHPMWGRDKTEVLVVDYGPQHRRDPLDGEWHGCFSPSQRPLCYHPPLRGF